jgi:hypothetical protein
MAFAVVALFLPRVVGAAEPVSKTIFERRLNEEDLAAHLDVNRQLGHAWIDVVLTQWRDTQTQESSVVPRALVGLYYDQARKQVIYRDGTKEAVCAEDSTFLWVATLKDTGQCQSKVSRERQTVVDGFNDPQVTVGKVVFEATPSDNPQ